MMGNKDAHLVIVEIIYPLYNRDLDSIHFESSVWFCLACFWCDH